MWSKLTGSKYSSPPGMETLEELIRMATAKNLAVPDPALNMRVREGSWLDTGPIRAARHDPAWRMVPLWYFFPRSLIGARD